MESTELETRAYTPQISRQMSAVLRRIAWFQNKPMTKTLEQIIVIFSSIIEPSKICLSCKDSTVCKTCVFCHLLSEKEKDDILAAFNLRRVSK